MNPQTYMAPQEQQEAPASFAAILPLLLFLLIFIGTGVSLSLAGVDMAFYQLSATVAILPAIALALMQGRARLSKKITIFLTGVGEINIITMCMIYLLAGGFASVASAIGGVKATVTAIGSVNATVNFGLSLVPPAFILPGLFLIGAFVSTAMGTSMGTVAAITPIALGVAAQTSIEVPVLMGVVLGGAMFGDNLSMISDTTIAATRTQGCEMGDKFRMNFLIVLPAALLTVALLWFSASGGTEVTLHDFELIRVLPYIAVLVLALTGLNAFIVLATGILLSGLVGLFCGIPGADGQIVPYSLLRWGQDIYKGFTGMNEIMVLSMLIGGLGELIRYHGGIAWLLARVDGLARRLAGKSGGKGSSRVGESCIALLASLADICTANNTVAIILTGGLAREIALKNGIDPRRSASLLDIFSCVFQGLIPWAAQLLLAGSLAKISPLEITINNWYCMLLAVAGILAIILGLPRIKARSTEA